MNCPGIYNSRGIKRRVRRSKSFVGQFSNVKISRLEVALPLVERKWLNFWKPHEVYVELCETSSGFNSVIHFCLIVFTNFCRIFCDQVSWYQGSSFFALLKALAAHQVWYWRYELSVLLGPSLFWKVFDVFLLFVRLKTLLIKLLHCVWQETVIIPKIRWGAFLR